GEESDLGHVVDAAEHHLAGHRIPVPGLLEDVVIRIAAVHLRGAAAALARQVIGVARLTAVAVIGEMVGAAEVESHRQRSRCAIAPSSAIAPTRMSDPGASSGGPMTR